MRPSSVACDLARLFFALWPPANVAQAIAKRCDALAIPGRRVACERLHLTLAFHGVCNAARAARLRRRASGVSLPAFDLVFNRVDHFARPAITWLGCAEAPGQLHALAAQLTPSRIDNKAFRAHVSVSRKSPFVAPRPIEPIVWHVDAFSLIASGEHGVPGAYCERQRWALG